MEPLKEAISVRSTRLNNQVLGRSTPAPGILTRSLAREGLLDALIALYDECNIDHLKKKDKNIALFVDKYRSVTSELRRLRVNISDFEVKNVIGRGHFGEVHVVREKQTGDVYAMKTLRKGDTLGKQGVTFYEEERDIMAHSQSPWLTYLQYAFQDSAHLYLVMEFHPGGDLLGLLERRGNGSGIGEDFSKFYLAELSLAIHALHSMGYVHRDIKPDNVLLDRCGHLKLADFGSAAKLSTSGLVTNEMPVGTPEYVAPEVLKALETPSSSKYGIACDYWSLGVVAYELIVGETPFGSDILSNTYNKIMTHSSDLVYPQHVAISDAYKNFISELLTDAQNRLTHNKILIHELFKDLIWTNIREQPPPFVPILKGCDDTSNFEEFEHKPSKPSIENFKTRTEFSGRNLPFIGFTFTQSIGNELPVCTKPFDSFSQVGKNVERNQMEMNAKDRKTIEELQQKIMKFEKQNQDADALERRLADKVKRVESTEAVRNRLERELATSKTENQSLKRMLDMERRERKTFEVQALELIAQTKAKWESTGVSKISTLTQDLQDRDQRIKDIETARDEIAKRLELAQKDLHSKVKELQEIRDIQINYKNNISKVKERQRQSIMGAESRLERIASENREQVETLQTKLEAEKKQRRHLEKRIIQLEATEKSLTTDLKDSRERYEDLENHVTTLELQVQQLLPLEDKLTHLMGNLEEKEKDDVKLKVVEDALKFEKLQNCSLRKQLQDLQNELGHSIHSLEAHELSLQVKDLERQALIKSLQEEIKSAASERENLLKSLQEAVTSDELNKSKVANLEQLLARLELGVERLESKEKENVNSMKTDRSVFLEEQITRLEEQLKAATEQAAVDKQNTRQTNTALWKKEKELSDSDLDKRIALRELKEVEEKCKILTEEKRKLLERITTEKTNHEQSVNNMSKTNETLKNELEKLKMETEKLQRRADMYQNKYETGKTITDKHNSELRDANNEINTKNIYIRELEDKFKSIENENIILADRYVLEHEKLKKVNMGSEERNAELKKLKLNNDMLKEACAMLEEQLNELEALCDGHERKTGSLQEQITSLEAILETSRGETISAKRLTNEERSLRLIAEKKCERLQNELGETQEEVSNLKSQILVYKEVINDLTGQLTMTEDKVATLEVSLKTEERMVEATRSECLLVKEEASTSLTQMCLAREESSRLAGELQEMEANNASLRAHIIDLEDSLNELKTFYQHREVKSEATMQQQTKLIDFLQSKMEDNPKKKKTLTDKLFGGSKKENVSPLPTLPLNYRELEASLAREKAKNRTLSEQLLEAKAELLGARGDRLTSLKDSQTTLPTSPRTRDALKEIVQSPSSQTRTELQRQPSRQRMHHNIPHRFENKICKKSTKCPVCNETLQFGRHISSCLECNVACHHKCCHLLPTTCGLPGGFVRHFSDSLKAQDNIEVSTSTARNVKMEGWVKLNQRGKSSWEQYYLKLEGSKLLTFKQEPSPQMKPESSLELKPSDGYTVITENVSTNDAGTVARSDIQFLLKVDVNPSTTCWPVTSQIIMALSPQDKIKWIEALRKCVGTKTPIGRYTGTSLLRLQDYHMLLDVNCAVEVDDHTILIGAEEGLYSYQTGKKPVHITGPIKVHQIAFVRSINKALLICEEGRSLVECDLRQLESMSHCAECVEPHLETKKIVFPGEKDTHCCHLFQVLDVQDKQQNVLLCAATSKFLVIFKFDVAKSAFIAQKALETGEAVSSILFTQHSIIVSANKFFEIDSKDYTAEEFLDETDKSLSYAIFAHQRKSFPIAILAITSKEYILCFNEFGVFVDEFGRRTRKQDISWSYIPISFTYRKPFLFIMHFSTVEVIKINDFAYLEDVDDNNSSINIPEQIFVELSNPRYLGNSSINGAIYVLNALSSGPEIVKLEGHSVIKSDYVESCESIDSESVSSHEGDKVDGPIYAQVNKMRKSVSVSDTNSEKFEHVANVSVNVYNPRYKDIVSSTESVNTQASEFSFTNSMVRDLELINALDDGESEESLSTMELTSSKRVRFGQPRHHQTDL